MIYEIRLSTDALSLSTSTDDTECLYRTVETLLRHNHMFGNDIRVKQDGRLLERSDFDAITKDYR